MEVFEAELAALRARAETLASRHMAADAAHTEAKSKLQRHHLEAPLDADEKARGKLEAAVATCAVTREGLADAIREVLKLIADAEQKIATERAAIERKAASHQLARDLDAVERILPEYLDASRRFVSALEALHHHFEATEIARFVANATAQIEVAAAFALQELRGMAAAIYNGSAPLPAPKLKSEPIAVIEPETPTIAVFMMKSAKFRDHDGRSQFAGQFEDATMPVRTAQRALRESVAVPTTDPRRAQLRGVRGGDFAPDAPDVVDLDAAEEPKAASPNVDPVMRAAVFTKIDRSAETRTIEIDAPRM
ncbi:hypothetical protein BSZ19_04055 [Bradyrhizobium japonicum]|uniref:Uncharacterized protein n=1 Tax=Bradyrhizobium japonicum TaxID=375 RepID=A0A1Y2JWK1_BRAJP|nr:hypothetical protein [Bradyrhizobium japonicum]OSJ36482.1 hypothetical protein BSZ19_04055 [Bradyrhizobium japonicum]